MERNTDRTWEMSELALGRYPPTPGPLRTFYFQTYGSIKHLKKTTRHVSGEMYECVIVIDMIQVPSVATAIQRILMREIASSTLTTLCQGRLIVQHATLGMNHAPNFPF